MWIVKAIKNVFIHYFLCSIEWGMCHNFLNKTLPPHPLWAESILVESGHGTGVVVSLSGWLGEKAQRAALFTGQLIQQSTLYFVSVSRSCFFAHSNSHKILGKKNSLSSGCICECIKFTTIPQIQRFRLATFALCVSG